MAKKVEVVNVNEVAADHIERLRELSLQLLAEVHATAIDVAERVELPPAEMIRLQHEILMRVVASMLNAQVDTITELTKKAQGVDRYDMNEMEVL